MNCNGWDSNLTEEQRRAASHIGTHARLLAGPGTGKTLTLTRRIVYLVHEQGVPPDDILVLTFTRAAAAELKQRVTEALGQDAGRVLISTLHSYALRVILQHGAGSRLPLPVRIADDFEERHIIEEDLKRLAGLRSVTEARDLLHQLSADWEKLTADQPGYRFPNPRFYGAWQEHREIFGYTLRAELVYQLKHALEEGDVQIERPPRYILVDEYQDLNACDLSVMKHITGLGAELYVAGDDDQSIYGFRYAEPDGIRRFEDDYDPAITLELQECHRCSPNILRLANYVVEQDIRRYPKELTPVSKSFPGEVHILNFPGQRKEAEGIARICKWLTATQDVNPEDILILLRSDRHQVFSKPIREELERQGLSASIAANPLKPLNHPEGRKFLSILRLVANEQDHLAWRTLLQLRVNGIGERALEEIYERARREGVNFTQAIMGIAGDPECLPKLGSRIESEVEQIQEIVGEARVTFETNTGFIDAISDLAAKHISAPGIQQDVIALFIRVIDTVSARDLVDLLRALNVSIGNYEQEKQKGAISIMTMHQAKGLTADAVVIVGAEDEYIPGRAQGTQVDDERRLLYVSLTRARRFLYITHCNWRTHQQAHTGRDPGSRHRLLTRFLRGGPVPSENGQSYIERILGDNDGS